MTPEEYNHLIELRNKCYRDRVCRETDITYFTGFNDGYEKGKEIFEVENAELKSKVGLSVDCDKAEKHGDLCLGYGGDEDEPCERCKNCIKCETGYYQLGETEKDKQIEELKGDLELWESGACKSVNVKKCEVVKDLKEQLTEAKEIIKKYLAIGVGGKITQNYLDVTKEARAFMSEVDCDKDHD